MDFSIRIGRRPRCRYDRSRRAIPHCGSDDAASIPKSGPEIKNRCTQQCINGENLASIPKFGPEIKNRCTQEGVNRQNLASIPKSGLEIKNRCTQGAVNRENLASIRKSGPEIRNRCSNKPFPGIPCSDSQIHPLKSRITAPTEPKRGQSLQRLPNSPPEIKNRCRK